MSENETAKQRMELELSAAADLCEENGMDNAAQLLRRINEPHAEIWSNGEYVDFQKLATTKAPTTKPASAESIMEW